MQTIEITGRVLGPDEAPVKAARVLVLDGLGAVLATAESDDEGRFSSDRSYAFNFGNPFSGTHFGAPRSVTCGLRLASR